MNYEKHSRLVMHLNVNALVRVRLTELGRKTHRANHERLIATVAPRLEPAAVTPVEVDYKPPKEDENGWSRWPLWQLMHEFGPLMIEERDGDALPFAEQIEIDMGTY